MAQSDHIIEIIIQTNDQTGGALGKVQNSLLALDKVVQKTHDRLKRAFSNAYSATIRLIDNVTPTGSKINDLLKRLAGKTYQLALRLNDGATNGIRNLEAKLMRLSAKAYTIAVNVKDNVSKKINGLADGALMGMGGMGVTMLGTAGIGYGAVNAIQSQMSFEKQMSAVKAISGATGQDFADLTAAAEKMGATTKFTAKEAADALYYMSMAGWKTKQSIAALPAVLNLAAAGNTELATTSDIVTDTMTGFGLKAGEMVKNANGVQVETSKHYADMMAALITNSNTDITQAGESLKYSASVVQAMYADGTAEDRMRGAEDLFMITGLMANAGIKGSQSGTSAKALMTRLGAMNRNADFARSHLGVDFVDQQSGEVRRLRDIVGDFRKVFNQGMDVGQAADFFEKLSGEKVHADTRRKLESFLKNVQEHGGKMTGADKLKMASMLSGQEAMSGWLATFLASEDDWNKIANAIDNCDGAAEKMAKIQLDNLAGDVTLLGSAWDAFQRNLVKGGASESLRGFVQTLTEVITKANELFSDGIQIGDFGKIIADVITRLKNKFLEFDGIGSILAGGALIAGLLKITKTATNLYSKMKSLKSLSIGSGIIPPTPTPTPTPAGLGGIGASQQITSMVVHANSVVVNGRTGNFGGKVGNQAYVDNYYKRRGEILAGQNSTGKPPTTSPVPPPTPPPTSSGIGGFARNGLRIAGGASILAGIFGAMDIYAARNHSKETLAEANQTVAYHRQVLEDLKNQNAAQDAINRQVEEVRAAEDFQRRTVKMNNQVERQAEYGAVGAVAGTALGAALGSAVPVIGTTIGGIIGGILGDFLGTKAADLVNKTENNAQQNSGNRIDFLAVGNKGIAEQSRHEENMLRWKNGEFGDAALEQAQQTRHEQAQRHEKNMQQYVEAKTGDVALARAHNDLIAKSGGYETQNAAAEKRHQELLQKGAELAAERNAKNTNWRQITAGNSLYGGGGYQDAFIAKTDEDRAALVAYDEDRKNKALRDAQARRVTKKTEQDAQTSDFLKQQGKSYNQMMTNAPERKGEEEHRVIDTNPFEVAKKNLDEQAAASHKQIDAQNELTQKIRDLNQQAQQAGENKDFFKDFSIGDFLDNLIFNKAAAQRLHDEEGGIENVTNPNPNYPQVANPKFEEKSFNFSDMLPDFDFSDLLPEFDLSDIFGEIDIGEKFQSLFEGIGEIDIASLLPDFSSIGDTIDEQLSVIPEKVSEITTSIGEGFSQIPTAASDAFDTISNYANEGLTEIQTKWNELPNFFDGLFSGLGDVASTAGSAIAEGINSGIGMIKSAWEEVSSWLSNKISSLSQMASNAVSSIMSFGGGGNVSPKAEGGFISSPQQILAGEAGLEVIIPLATSRRKRALDLLKKTAAIVGGDSVNITGDQFKPEEKFFAPNSKNISTLEKAKNLKTEKNIFPELSAGDKQLSDVVKISESGISPKFDELGNVKGYNGIADNIINKDDDLLVRRAKQEEQLRQYSNQPFKELSFSEGEANVKNVENAVNRSEIDISSPKFDALGNIKDFNGLAENFITTDDDLLVQRAKHNAQLKEFWANNSEFGEGLSVEEGAVTSGGGNVDNSVGGINLGGIQASFDVSGAESPQEVMQTIRENLGDLADQISGTIAEKISEIRMNMPLMA